MKHRIRVAGLAAATALMVTACGSSTKSATPTTAAPATAASGAATTAGGAAPTTLAGHACDGSLKGKTVTITSSIRDTEAEKLVSAWKPFEDCTGVTI